MDSSRRDWLAAWCAAGLLPQVAHTAESSPTDLEAAVLKRHDAAVDSNLAKQNTDPASEYRGAIPDAYGIHWPGTGTGLANQFAVAFLHPKSKHHHSPQVFERLKMAMDYVMRTLSPDGNIFHPQTNFNSPPDTAFAVLAAGEAASIARKHSNREVEQAIKPFLDRAAGGLTKGGIHTPNHRWVLCSALAIINDLYPDPRFLKRIDQWLAEGIDIDDDGQYDERSIIGYNIIVDRAFVTLAHKLKRPELLDPVRKNLDAAFYLMHPGDEMVTEISHRQDRNARGNIGVYWFPMHYMAIHDRNPRYAWVAHKYAQQNAGLSALMDYPELLQPLPTPTEPSTNYHQDFKALEISRIRRGHKSATLMLRGDSRFLQIRSGSAVVEAVRFASAFFGRGQFIPRQWGRDGDTYTLRQSLSAPYYQPLDPPHRVKAGEWGEVRGERQRTEMNYLEQWATITETEKGFSVSMHATGAVKVPVAIEVAVRGTDGLQLDGLVRAPDVTNGFLLASGQAVVKAGDRQIRFGPGRALHQYTQIRGAEAKMPGGCIYITGYTPFHHTLEFECL
ncbi:MAG: hypothetical protein JNK87_19545 [Bryobacterales bacterium]|nr:hypothetical protein [Bryobacterales bacterium]